MSVPDDQPHTRTRYPTGEQPPEPAARRPLRTLAAVLVVVVVLVGAVAVLNRTSGSPTGSPAGSGTSGDGAGSGSGTGDGTGKSTAATGTTPVTTTQNGIAVGFPHTGEGAQSAAVNYAVALGSAEMYSTATRKTIVTTVADPSAASRLLGRFDPSYTALGKRLGLDDGKARSGLVFISRTVPVGTKADGYSADRATVEVWTTGLIGLSGQSSTAPVTEYWQTSTIQLHWTSNDWKVVDVSTKDGPTPVSGSQVASSAQDIAGAVTQFGGFRYAR
ncbi:hypothetical protein ACEZDB_23155 [Streptacidiphilus sp. N1-3]|uniref:Integral membrane protein n=1 Tax=Streptacidiphilus alkalitolerans TaxID=3342712 RepID=A0ABV6X5K1_9ACTN